MSGVHPGFAELRKKRSRSLTARGSIFNWWLEVVQVEFKLSESFPASSKRHGVSDHFALDSIDLLAAIVRL